MLSLGLSIPASSPASLATKLPKSRDGPDSGPDSSLAAERFSSGSNQSYLRTVSSPGIAGITGKYDVGIRWQRGDAPPIVVDEAQDLWDETGKDVSEFVTSGDVLTHVDLIDVTSFSVKVVSKMVCGDRGSTVGLRFTSAVTGRSYELELRRHLLIENQLPVSEMEQHSLMAQQEHLPHHLEVDIEDLDRNWNHDDRGSLGIHIALGSEDPELGPKQVQHVLPGSTAHGRILRGDEIVAVNGETVTEENIKEKVRGHSLKGEKVRITVRRDGKVFDEDLIRSSSFRLQKLDEIFELLEEHEDTLSKLEDPEPMNKHQAIVEKIVHMEKEAAELDHKLLRRMADLVTHYRVKVEHLEAHLSSVDGEFKKSKTPAVPAAKAAPAPRNQAQAAFNVRSAARQNKPVDPEAMTFAERSARARAAMQEEEARIKVSNGQNIHLI